MPRYDLLVIDLDGTLIGRDGEVSAANRRAVDRARDAGMEVVVATGRAPGESREQLAAIGHVGLLIAAGGSLLCDADTGRTVARAAMDHALVTEVTHVLVEHGHKAIILKDNSATGYDYLAVGPHPLDAASEWWFDVMPVTVHDVAEAHEDPHPHDTVRTGAVGREGGLAPVAERLRERVGDRATLQHWAAVVESRVTGSATHLLEVFTLDVSKWTMIERLCAERGIDSTRVAAIGDGLNDVEMVGNAGLGVAMANADPRVTVVADRMTLDHGEDGVAAAIDHIVAERW